MLNNVDKGQEKEGKEPLGGGGCQKSGGHCDVGTVLIELPNSCLSLPVIFTGMFINKP